MKDSFSRAACNYVEKNCNLRRYNELLSKSMLVALCENKGEKTIETSVSIWRGFSLLFNRGFSRLLVLFEKFRCFWRGRHCKEGMQMTRQFYFEVTFKHDMATADWKKSEYKTIAGRRNSWRKNWFEKERNFSWRKTTLSAFELRQNWETLEIQLEARLIQRKGGLILLEKDAQTTLQYSSSYL